MTRLYLDEDRYINLPYHLRVFKHCATSISKLTGRWRVDIEIDIHGKSSYIVLVEIVYKYMQHSRRKFGIRIPAKQVEHKEWIRDHYFSDMRICHNEKVIKGEVQEC